MALTVRELVTKWTLQVSDSSLAQTEKRIESLKSSIARFSILTGAAVVKLGIFVNEAAKLEQAQIAFSTMLGSVQKANELLSNLYAFAAKTPFTIPGIEQSAKMLLAVGVSTEDLIPTLKALGDVASGLSIPLERLVLNYGQVLTQQKLTGRELRDFLIAGVPLLDELAKNMGKSVATLRGEIEKGSVQFKDVREAFITMTQSGGRFANLMSKQASSLLGIYSNIKDILTLLARAAGGAVLDNVKQLAIEFLNFVTVNKELISTKLVAFFKDVLSLIKFLVGTGRSAVSTILKITSVFGGLAKVLRIVVKLMMLMIAIKMLIVLGSWVMSITKLASTLILLATGFRTAGTAAIWMQAKMLLIPLLIGAAIAGIFVIVDDLVAYFQGRKSLFGLLMNKISESVDQFMAKIDERITAFKAMIAGVIDTISIIGPAFDKASKAIKIMDVIGKIKEGFSKINLFATATSVKDSLQKAVRSTAPAITAAQNSGMFNPGSSTLIPNSTNNTYGGQTVNVYANTTINTPNGTNAQNVEGVVREEIRKSFDKTAREIKRSAVSGVQ